MERRLSLHCGEKTYKLLMESNTSADSLEESCQLYGFIVDTLIIGMVVVVGITGNSLTFAVFWKGNFKTSTSFLFMCLALTDSAVLQTAIPTFSIDPFVAYTGYTPDDGFITYIVKLMGDMLHPVAHSANIWVTVLIVANRYITVCAPSRASQWCTDSNVKIQLAAVLIVTLQFNIASLVMTIMWFSHHVYTFVSYPMLILILPTFIITSLNVRLVKTLNAHRRMPMQNQSSQDEDSTTFVLVIVGVVLIVCQLPRLVYLVLTVTLPDDLFTCGGYLFYLEPITNTFTILKSAINLMILIRFNKAFRDVLIQQVLKRRAPQQVAISPEMADIERANGEPPVNDTCL